MASFPYEESSLMGKVRPIIVLNVGEKVLAVKVTSHKARSWDGHDIQLDWKAASLRRPSVARISKSIYIDAEKLLHKIGELSPRDQERIAREYGVFVQEQVRDYAEQDMSLKVLGFYKSKDDQDINRYSEYICYRVDGKELLTDGGAVWEMDSENKAAVERLLVKTEKIDIDKFAQRYFEEQHGGVLSFYLEGFGIGQPRKMTLDELLQEAKQAAEQKDGPPERDPQKNHSQQMKNDMERKER